MRRLLVSAVAVIAALVITGPAAAAASSSVAALQVALRAHGHYAAVGRRRGRPTDTDGPDGLPGAHRSPSHRPRGNEDAPRARLAREPSARAARARDRSRRVGRLVPRVQAHPVRPQPEGRRRPFHRLHGEGSGSSPGCTSSTSGRHRGEADLPRTRRRRLRRIDHSPSCVAYTVRAGESFYAIAARLRREPPPAREEESVGAERGDRARPEADPARRSEGVAARRPRQRRSAGGVSRDAVRAALDRWSAVYGVDPRLARATAWMESGFQSGRRLERRGRRRHAAPARHVAVGR